MSSNDALTVISNDIYSVRAAFDAALADPGISFEREAGFAIQQLSRSEYAMKVAMANRQSVVDAVVNIAAIGISLNPARKQAYLVPRDGRICLDISYMGLLDIAVETGSIRWGQAELVYEKDTFELNGVDEKPTHKRDPLAKDRGEIVGAYVVVKTIDGDFLTTAMQIGEVYDIRNRSVAWQSWASKKTKCPWVTDEGEMIKKTLIKRAWKTWPKADRDRLDNAINYLNSDGGEGLDLVQDAAQASAAIPEDLLANARAASLEGWSALAKFIKGITEQQRALLEPESRSLKEAARKADEQKKGAQDAVA